MMDTINQVEQSHSLIQPQKMSDDESSPNFFNRNVSANFGQTDHSAKHAEKPTKQHSKKSTKKVLNKQSEISIVDF